MKYQKTFTTEAQMLATDFANADYPLLYYSQDDHGIVFETYEDYEASEIHNPPLRISTPCKITLTHYGTNATTTKPKIYFDGHFTTLNNNPSVWSLDNQVFDDDGTEEFGDVGYIELWGDNPDGFSHSGSDYTIMKIEGENIEVRGNIMALISNEIPDELPSRHCFSYLFANSEIVDASGLILPATTLADYCYQSMFWGCTALTTAPELPATTLADDCYEDMFKGCSSLTSAPELPATTLARMCYSSMFSECTALTSAPELPATTLAVYCYNTMFSSCTALTAAPELPATTLAHGCYRYMFYDCTALTAAPELPATTLAEGCYDSMFYRCTALTAAPELPATTLASSCYSYMFQICTSLTAAPELPATTLAEGCYSQMFNGCTSLNSLTIYATSIIANSMQNMLQGITTTGTLYVPASKVNDSNYMNIKPSNWTIAAIQTA